MIVYLSLFLAFLGLSASVRDCDLCRIVFEKYRSAFYDIDPDISLGGGNTDWEEKFIGKYAFSELHAFETLEKTLKALNDREAHFLSEIEGELESFWVDYLKTGLSNLDDVVNVFCIEKLSLCCPWNKLGEECLDCGPCEIGPVILFVLFPIKSLFIEASYATHSSSTLSHRRRSSRPRCSPHLAVFPFCSQR